MNFVWNTNELNASVVSIYETNITLNTTACMHFENVNYVLLGIDYDNHCIGIKPVGKQAINDGIYPQDQLHKISRGKSYGRITNKPFIKELNEKLDCPITLKKIDQESIKEDLKDTYLLVNTTSVGMAPHPEGCIIESADMLPDGLKVADIIYNPKETKLLSYARQRGLDYMNGERMIVYQGACSFKFWTGKDMPIHEVKVALGMEESE